MDSLKPFCPHCGSAVHVYKVSQVYITGITEPGSRTAGDHALLADVFGEVDLPSEGKSWESRVRTAIRPFAPPSGRTGQLRPLHPDWVVGGFSLAAVIFLINIYISQRFWFGWAMVICAVTGVGYGLARRGLLRQFQAAQQAAWVQKEKDEQVIGRWMQLYYCAEDGCVFYPKAEKALPLEQMEQLLMNGCEDE